MIFPIAVFLTISALANAGIQIKGKIVGGTEVSIEQYPYAVSVRIYDTHICGGSIISHTEILTAAHCTYGMQASAMSIRTGATKADYGILHQVLRIHQNPKYNDDNTENDASILELATPIIFTKSSQPAKLAMMKRLADNSSVEICGWGLKKFNGFTKGLGKMSLRAVQLSIVNQEICRKNYEEETNINDLFLCAAAKGKDSCQGDSGGALIDTATRRIVGLSSFGEGCAVEGKPGVYSSVMAMRDFLNKFI